jgi:hypothetical protein
MVVQRKSAIRPRLSALTVLIGSPGCAVPTEYITGKSPMNNKVSEIELLGRNSIDASSVAELFMVGV